MAGGPKEILDPSGRPFAPVAVRTATSEQVYAELAKKFSEKLRGMTSLPPEQFVTKYIELLRNFLPYSENAFKQLKAKYPDLAMPSNKAEIAEKLLAGDDKRFMTAFYVDYIDAATEKFDKIVKDKLRGKADAVLNELNNYRGHAMEGWTIQDIGNDLVRKKLVTKEQFAEIVKAATDQGILEKVEFAITSMQYVPKTEASKTWRESARSGVSNLGETRFSDVRKAIVRAVLAPYNFATDAAYRAEVFQKIKDFDPKFSTIIKGAVVAGLVVGVVFLVGKCSGCGEETTPKGGKTTPVIVKEAAPLAGIDNALTDIKGVGSRVRRETIFKGREGEEYARQVTAQVKSRLSNANEQERAFQIVRSLVAANESLARNPEAVLALVGAITELQKAKKTAQELASVAYKMVLYYQPGAFVNIAKDVVAQLAKNPRADPVALVSEPDKFFPNKYTKQMTAEWSQRPFQIFTDMGFDVNKPFVKNASARIREYFRREDWDTVAIAMAEFYKSREYAASKTLPSPNQKPEVPSSHELHLALLSMLMYSSSKPGANLENPAKGLSLAVGMDALRLFAKNVNPATEWSGDEAGQRRQLPIWQLAATQLLALNPNSQTLDEKLGMVLSANPGWKITGSKLGQGRDTSALIASLVGADSQVKLSEKQQKAFTTALTTLFAPDRQLEVANALVPTLSKSMGEEQLAEAVNGYGFEAKAGWRTKDWNLYMDRELSDYFPKDAKGKSPKEKDQAASILHGLATHEQYLAAREALIKFADKFEKKNSAEASPKALLEAAEKIVGMVREAKAEPDTEKMSDKALIPGKKKRR